MRREHELLVQRRTGMVPGAALEPTGAGLSGMRSPSASGVLQLPSATMINRPSATQVFDEHPGLGMQHPYQQLDPAMLSNNTAPRFMDTSARQWNPANQSFLQAQQASLFAQERQRAFQQDAALDRTFSNMGSMGMGNTMGGSGGMGNSMGGMGGDFGMGRQGFSGQFGMGGNQGTAGLMDSLSTAANPVNDIGLLRQQAFQGQGLSPLEQLRNNQAARLSTGMDMGGAYSAERSMMSNQLAVARMGRGPSAGASWNNSFAAGGNLAGSAGLQQQQQQQNQQQQGGHLTADEMARYLRGHFGA